MQTSGRRSKVFLKKNKKKSLEVQQDLNSRLVTVNQALMQQMEAQQELDTQTVLRQREEQGKILRELMGERKAR